MKVKDPINLHKSSTTIFVLGLMFAFDNFKIAAWVCLSLQATYELMWLFKDMLYPVKECEEDTSIFQGLIVFTSLSAAWTAPFLLISHRVEPPTSLITLAICTYLIGIIIFLCSHIQKYFFLKYKSGLITDVFFSRCRNPNYLGEILIYLSFAILSQHWLPFVIIGGLIVGIFIPNMVEKDLFLSRYPEFAEYKEQSGLLIPKIFVDSKIKLVKTDE